MARKIRPGAVKRGTIPSATYACPRPGMNVSSPGNLILTTAQRILMDTGYQLKTNPMHILPAPTAQIVLDTFQVTVSPEEKDYSLIRKQTSKLKIENPAIIDPVELLLKPGLSTAKQLRIPAGPMNPLFNPDYNPTAMQQKQYNDYKIVNKGEINLTKLAIRFCTTSLSVNGRPSKYFQNITTVGPGNLSLKGRTIVPPQPHSYSNLPGVA